MTLIPKVTRHRFAITGAQGSGKTTLAIALYEASLREFPERCALLSGIGHEVAGKGYPLGLEATAETIFAFGAAHLRRERECISALVIQDRCLVDLLAYARVRNCLGSAAVELLEQLVIYACSTFDAIFYLPISEATRAIVRSSENADFRAAVDGRIEQLSRELGLVLLEIVGTAEERLAAAFAIVRERMRS